MSWEELQRINKALYNAKHGLDKFGETSNQGRFFLSEIQILKQQKADLPPEILRREQVEIITQKFIRTVQREMLGGLDQRLMDDHRQSLQELGVSDDEIQHIVDSTRESYQEVAQEKIVKALKQKIEASLRDYYDSTGKALRVNVQAIVDGNDAPDAKIGKMIQQAVKLDIGVAMVQSQIDTVLLLSDTGRQAKLNKLASEVRDYITAIEFKAELDSSYVVPVDMVQEITVWESDESAELTRSQTDVLRAKRDLAIYGVTSAEIEAAIRGASNS